jgi:hypothetical protein
LVWKGIKGYMEVKKICVQNIIDISSYFIYSFWCHFPFHNFGVASFSIRVPPSMWKIVFAFFMETHKTFNMIIVVTTSATDAFFSLTSSFLLVHFKSRYDAYACLWKWKIFFGTQNFPFLFLGSYKLDNKWHPLYMEKC